MFYLAIYSKDLEISLSTAFLDIIFCFVVVYSCPKGGQLLTFFCKKFCQGNNDGLIVSGSMH